MITQHPSPNFGARRAGLTPAFVVLHYTAMATAEAAIARLCDPAFEVSAHYVIAKTGEITQLVDENMRAWHAGAGCWMGLEDLNSRSIGIELDNAGNHPFPEPQMHSLEQLLSGIMTRWSIPPEAVLGHSDLAIGRKIDPGPHFDWARLAKQFLAASQPKLGTQDQSFGTLAGQAGYDNSKPPSELLHAVRLRWNQGQSGPLCPSDHAVFWERSR